MAAVLAEELARESKLDEMAPYWHCLEDLVRLVAAAVPAHETRQDGMPVLP